MKKILIVFIACGLLVSFAPRGIAGETVWQKNSSVTFSGGKRTVSAVFVDLKDKTIRMEAALAKNQVGQVDELKNIAEGMKSSDRQVIGAINGTFFNAYSDFQPSGTIQTKGEYVHIAQTGSVMGFTADNTFVMDNLYTYISGSINGSYDYPNNWSAWGFNHRYDASDSTMVFTPPIGKTTGKHSKTSIVVDHGIVTKISSGEAPIPTDGYTIVTGDSGLVKRFSLGDKVDYRLDFFKSNAGIKGLPLNWGNTRTSLGAGPTLVKGGKILADGKAEGFKESKINSARAQRSFAGITKDNILILGTVPNATVKELGEIAKKLGIINGMNLDGGASSSLYFKGKYITAPGRKLSNALVITKLKELPIRVQFNGQDVFYSQDPYMTKTGVIMVPLKEAFEDIDAQIYFKNSNKSISVKRYEKTYEFSVGSASVSVDGQVQKLSNAVENKNGQSYVPLEFVALCLEGNLTNSGKIASITADLAGIEEIYLKAKVSHQKKDYDMAEELYQRILERDPRHTGALLSLAALSNTQKKFDRAILYYSRYLEIKPKDLDMLYSLGWAYYNNMELEKTIETFNLLTAKKPDHAPYWIALGSVYNHYSIKEYNLAKECFDKALTLKPTKAQAETIQKQLEIIRKALN